VLRDEEKTRARVETELTDERGAFETEERSRFHFYR
jgi:hypothetical protein